MKSAIAKTVTHLQWGLVVITLYFSTIALGGINPKGLYVTRLLVLSGFFLQLVLFFIEDRPFNRIPRPIRFPLVAFSVFLVLVFFQSFFGLRLIQNFPIGSIDSHVTYQFLVQSIIYFMFFFVCFQVAAQRQLVERLATLVILMTFAVAILGLAQKSLTDEKILWKAFVVEEWRSFGPFINENHFGGFLGLTFPLALGLMHYRFNKVLRTHAAPNKAMWSNWIPLLNEGVAFLFFLVILTLVACFFAAARVSWIVLLFICVAYFVAYAMKEKNIRFYFVLLVILTSSFLLLQWVIGGTFSNYFTSDLISRAWHVRFTGAYQSLGLFSDYPFFGTGLGTYGLISPKVVSFLINETWWNHAHNDFVELLTDTGIIGFCLFIGAVSALVFYSIRTIRTNESRWNQSIAVQACIAIFCIGVMEFSDFHLRIPSIALLFVLQLALLCQSGRSNEVDASGVSLFVMSFARFQRLIQGIVSLAGLVLIGLIFFVSTNEYRASILAQSQVGDRLTNLHQAIELQPANASLWYELGKAYRKKAYEPAAKNENSFRLLSEAMVAFGKATSLSPARAHIWFELGILEYTLGHKEESISSLEQAVHWAPEMIRYSLYLLAVYLVESEKAPEMEERIEYLKKAKDLYQELQGFQVKPRTEDYRTWMGERYYKKLQRLMPSWGV